MRIDRKIKIRRERKCVRERGGVTDRQTDMQRQGERDGEREKKRGWGECD